MLITDHSNTLNKLAHGNKRNYHAAACGLIAR